MTETKKTEHLLWLDLEMTGLNVEKERIIEAAAIVTDLNLNELDTFHSVVKQPQKFLNSMDSWNQKTHSESGLLQLIPKGNSPEKVEEDLCQFVEKNIGSSDVVLAGNSISQDRAFINMYFKKLSQMLHYRMLDVTSWKILFKDKWNQEFEKNNGHRALDDVRESIKELKHYLSFIKLP